MALQSELFADVWHGGDERGLERAVEFAFHGPAVRSESMVSLSDCEAAVAYGRSWVVT